MLESLFGNPIIEKILFYLFVNQNAIPPSSEIFLETLYIVFKKH